MPPQVECTAKPSTADSPGLLSTVAFACRLTHEYPESSILCFNLSLSLTIARHTQSRVLFQPNERVTLLDHCFRSGKEQKYLDDIKSPAVLSESAFLHVVHLALL